MADDMEASGSSIHNIVCDPKEPVGSYDNLPPELKEFIQKQKAECTFLRTNQIYESLPADKKNLSKPSPSHVKADLIDPKKHEEEPLR